MGVFSPIALLFQPCFLRFYSLLFTKGKRPNKALHLIPSSRDVDFDPTNVLAVHTGLRVEGVIGIGEF